MFYAFSSRLPASCGFDPPCFMRVCPSDSSLSWGTRPPWKAPGGTRRPQGAPRGPVRPRGAPRGVRRPQGAALALLRRMHTSPCSQLDN
eukprot:8876944-Pyramimonas_sp.AAC.1